MKYFNYLDIDFQPAAAKLKDYLIKKDLIADIKSAWRKLDKAEVLAEVPEIDEMFKPLGLEIDLIAIFVTYVKTGAIHIDDDVHSCRINFPIMNCENTVTNFYKVKSTPEVASQVNGYKLHQFPISGCDLVSQMKLTKAAVMRVLEPHQVITKHNNHPRVSCTIAFKQDISYLLEI